MFDDYTPPLLTFKEIADATQETKRCPCPQCGEKDRRKFYRSSKFKDGLCIYCRQCTKKMALEFYRGKIEKDLDGSYRKLISDRAKKRRQDNIEIARAKDKAKYLANPALFVARTRARRLRLQYGITTEQYEEMKVAQRGRCAICDQVPAEKFNAGR